MDEKHKYCRDCKWYGRVFLLPWYLQYCNNPNTKDKGNLVLPSRMFAEHARRSGQPCGPNGDLWEPR